MDLRKLLFITSSREVAIPIPGLRAAGWDIVSVRGVEQAREFIGRGGFSVGLVCLDRADVRALYDLEELFLSARSMEWIALVTPQCFENVQIRRLVLERFHDYHRLPVDVPRLVVTLGHAHGLATIRAEPSPISGRYKEYRLAGESPVMVQFFRDLEKIAAADAPVLVMGESGTGKELTAVAVHRLSRRADKPFVVVNCGAMAPSLIQAELFGYEKGSYTGADHAKMGRFEVANGGTILLDEIGDLSLDLQVNLLRFLQENTIERVGGRKAIRLDVRVLAATHVDLEEAMEQGRFRSDLYYRLNVLRVNVPPLRERVGDVTLLANFFLEMFGREGSRRVSGFSQAALRALNRHDWPGNVRELINRVRRAAVMCENCLIAPADLGLEHLSSSKLLATLQQARADAEREIVTRVLAWTGGNVSESARHLRISRVTLYRLMEKHGVSV